MTMMMMMMSFLTCSVFYIIKLLATIAAVMIGSYVVIRLLESLSLRATIPVYHYYEHDEHDEDVSSLYCSGYYETPRTVTPPPPPPLSSSSFQSTTTPRVVQRNQATIRPVTPPSPDSWKMPSPRNAGYSSTSAHGFAMHLQKQQQQKQQRGQKEKEYQHQEQQEQEREQTRRQALNRNAVAKRSPVLEKIMTMPPPTAPPLNHIVVETVMEQEDEMKEECKDKVVGDDLPVDLFPNAAATTTTTTTTSSRDQFPNTTTSNDTNNNDAPHAVSIDTTTTTTTTPALGTAPHARVVENDFRQLLQSERLSVADLATWQGRTMDSSATCAINSYLIATLHLSNVNPDGLPQNQPIEEIIDVIAPPMALGIRQDKLGTSNIAEFVFQDWVLDYLGNDGGLSRHLTELGCSTTIQPPHLTNIYHGNLMGGDGFDEFMQIFTADMSSKMSATILYQEHVISIHRGTLENGQPGFRLVETLKLPGHSGAISLSIADPNALRVTLQHYAYNSYLRRHDIQQLAAHMELLEHSPAGVDLSKHPLLFEAYVYISSSDSIPANLPDSYPATMPVAESTTTATTTTTTNVASSAAESISVPLATPSESKSAPLATPAESKASDPLATQLDPLGPAPMALTLVFPTPPAATPKSILRRKSDSWFDSTPKVKKSVSFALPPFQPTPPQVQSVPLSPPKRKLYGLRQQDAALANRRLQQGQANAGAAVPSSRSTRANDKDADDMTHLRHMSQAWNKVHSEHRIHNSPQGMTRMHEEDLMRLMQTKPDIFTDNSCWKSGARCRKHGNDDGDEIMSNNDWFYGNSNKRARAC